MLSQQQASAAVRTQRAPAAPLLLILIFAAELAAHLSLLTLPYYWDEAGYYIPAAYDFFRTGSVIPSSTLTNAHPPGLSLYLAAAWKVFGFSPLTTRISMCFASAAALLAVFRLAADALQSRSAAAAVVLLTALYPVWFAQSTLAHADMLAAAATLWGLALLLASEWKGGANSWHFAAAATCFAVAALTKEIAIGTPLALALAEATRRERGWLGRAGVLCAPVLPLAAWFGYHRWRTGFTFGNPQYLHYNATATLAPARVLLALGHRILHLSAHLNLFVPVLIALGSLTLPVLPGRHILQRATRSRIWIVLVANAVLFSVLGGALLTRYLLPMYPLVLLLAVAAVTARVRSWYWYPAAGIAAFLAGLLLPPPYRIAPEDTLAYRDSVVLEQHAIDEVLREYPHGAVLSAWPVTDGLRKPELGYVRTPVPVVAIDNFSLPVLQALAGTPQDYSTAIVFSTKYEPPGVSLGRWAGQAEERAEERYFNLHHDLSAAVVAELLGGTVVWQERRAGQWAAVLHMDHPQLAQTFSPLLNREPASYNGP